MSFTDSVKEVLISMLEQLGVAVWIEVATESPRCTYYFGPFSSVAEAEAAQAGYVEDLEAEGATGIVATIKRCKPEHLTVYEEAADFFSMKTPSLSVNPT